MLLPVAPYLATRAHASAAGSAIVLALYGIGALICHQRPERSFHLWAAQLPVCARCTGIYIGAAVASVVAAVRGTKASGSGDRGRKKRARPPALPERSRARAVLAAAVVPTALTLLYEWTTGRMPANMTRAAAGMPIGVAVAWLVLHATDGETTAENQVN